MATPEIFPTCYHMDHRTIPVGATCRFCKSPPYRDTADAPPTPAESVMPTPSGLPDPPAPLPSARLPHRPSIMIPNAVTAARPPAFGLASSQTRRMPFPRQRGQLPPRIQSSTPIPVAADPPPPPAEIKYLFAVAIAIGHWPSEDALECRFTPLENKASAEIDGNRNLIFNSFLHEFLDAAKGVPIQAAFRYDRGNWRIAMNYKSRQTPLTFLPHWTGSRLVKDIIRSWPHRAAVYPVTICWEPSQDQTLSDDPWDTLSFRSTYPPEVQRVEESTPEPSAESTPEPPAESTPEPPAAKANHRRGISEVTPRSEREQQDEKERPATRRGGRRVGASELEQQDEEERPATRRGGRRVGASELEGLSVGGGEAQGTSEGKVTRTRKIRAPRRPPGDELQ
jgi:hypothetical protein